MGFLRCFARTAVASLPAPPSSPSSVSNSNSNSTSTASSTANATSVSKTTSSEPLVSSPAKGFVPRTVAELHPEYAHSEPYHFASRTESSRAVLANSAAAARRAGDFLNSSSQPASPLPAEKKIVVRGPQYSARVAGADANSAEEKPARLINATPPRTSSVSEPSVPRTSVALVVETAGSSYCDDPETIDLPAPRTSKYTKVNVDPSTSGNWDSDRENKDTGNEMKGRKSSKLLGKSPKKASKPPKSPKTIKSPILGRKTRAEQKVEKGRAAQDVLSTRLEFPDRSRSPSFSKRESDVTSNSTRVSSAVRAPSPRKERMFQDNSKLSEDNDSMADDPDNSAIELGRYMNAAVMAGYDSLHGSSHAASQDGSAANSSFISDSASNSDRDGTQLSVSAAGFLDADQQSVSVSASARNDMDDRSESKLGGSERHMVSDNFSIDSDYNHSGDPGRRRSFEFSRRYSDVAENNQDAGDDAPSSIREGSFLSNNSNTHSNSASGVPSNSIPTSYGAGSFSSGRGGDDNMDDDIFEDAVDHHDFNKRLQSPNGSVASSVRIERKSKSRMAAVSLLPEHLRGTSPVPEPSPSSSVLKPSARRLASPTSRKGGHALPQTHITAPVAQSIGQRPTGMKTGENRRADSTLLKKKKVKSPSPPSPSRRPTPSKYMPRMPSTPHTVYFEDHESSDAMSDDVEVIDSQDQSSSSLGVYGATEEYPSMPSEKSLVPIKMMNAASRGDEGYSTRRAAAFNKHAPLARKSVTFRDEKPVIIEPNLRERHPPSRSVPRNTTYGSTTGLVSALRQPGKPSSSPGRNGNGPRMSISFDDKVELIGENPPPRRAPATPSPSASFDTQLSQQSSSSRNSSRRSMRIDPEQSRRRSMAVAEAMADQIRGVPRSAMLAYNEHDVDESVEDDYEDTMQDLSAEDLKFGSARNSVRPRFRSSKTIPLPPKIIPGVVPAPPPPPPFVPEPTRVRSIRMPPPPPKPRRSVDYS